MVQSKIISIDVAFLTYNSRRSANSPSVKMDSACTANVNDLRIHREQKRKNKDKMGRESYHHYKWYSSMLMREVRDEPERFLKINHWRIESGNSDAFMIDGTIYRSVSIIIGSDMEHWYCANGSKHTYGSRYRNFSHQKDNQIACFTINDNEATLVVQPQVTFGSCTSEICANNCIECKKYKSAFTKTNTMTKCACFPKYEDFQTMEESDVEIDSDSEDQDIAHMSEPYKDLKEKFNKFKLNAIREESLTN
ncbi:CLUMA_CG011211, isoform A [Clunio marinus]|uniref:CLUMA_CG011211, isoform A n=1 Tax=Clunio marinus TaxID=568069 RepID=A0A1J1ICA7_9DIPT|nr:CLUMA_CG011211, isoform A [Clunio marinus]